MVGPHHQNQKFEEHFLEFQDQDEVKTSSQERMDGESAGAYYEDDDHDDDEDDTEGGANAAIQNYGRVGEVVGRGGSAGNGG